MPPLKADFIYAHAIQRVGIRSISYINSNYIKHIKNVFFEGPVAMAPDGNWLSKTHFIVKVMNVHLKTSTIQFPK